MLYNRINLGYVSRQSHIKIVGLNKYKTILVKLTEEKFILGFNLINENGKKNIVVYLQPFRVNLRIISKPSKIYTIKLKHILKANSRYTASVYILDTNKGYLTLNECAQESTGGIIALKCAVIDSQQ